MNNKGADQTVQMLRLICTFVFAYGVTGFLMTWLILKLQNWWIFVYFLDRLDFFAV